mmetsp:Transcript_12439/g.39226  ORF Transcript_12439/g.39226 Transcript_12439/m.39226 type:complete len:182 (-) Transcript_12439:206-751(-)
MARVLLFLDAPSTGATRLLAILVFLSLARSCHAARLPALLPADDAATTDALGAAMPGGSVAQLTAAAALAQAGAAALSAALAGRTRRSAGGGQSGGAAEGKDAGSREEVSPDAALAGDRGGTAWVPCEELVSNNHHYLCVHDENDELDRLLAGERTTAASREYESAMDLEYSRYFDQMLTA